ncbi:hypothetical protein OH76DRAFT_1021430 [Lentinus brumalis]|uniref:Uncharacterized protein n=1 Tax=Lentinus brumalis TaxID=2498619 RepID=A0A371CXU5_9APHY|nr:hypothetical protein OH76DRAFT_1021430 [Polyporus brumalis]
MWYGQAAVTVVVERRRETRACGQDASWRLYASYSILSSIQADVVKQDFLSLFAGVHYPIVSAEQLPSQELHNDNSSGYHRSTCLLTFCRNGLDDIRGTSCPECGNIHWDALTYRRISARHDRNGMQVRTIPLLTTRNHLLVSSSLVPRAVSPVNRLGCPLPRRCGSGFCPPAAIVQRRPCQQRRGLTLCDSSFVPSLDHCGSCRVVCLSSPNCQ